MPNYLVELKNMVKEQKISTLIGEVVSSANNKVSVQIPGGNTIEVWGTAKIGTNVLIKDGVIVATVAKENIPVIYIA